MAYKFKDYTKSDDVKKAEAKATEYDTYNESNAVTDYRNKMSEYETNNKVAEWNGGTYGDAVKDAWNNINNRAKFSYDLNGDALYQQYKDKFINQGRLAMADTMGQASAMTGGYGSSYAVTAGNQAYQSHLQNLNDIVPQLYQMAYDRYTQEGQDLKDKYSILNNMYQTEYGEHRDKKSDYYTELGRLTEAYNTERAYDRGVYETDRTHYTTVADNLYNRDFNAHNVAEQNAFNAYQQGVTEAYQQAQMAASLGDVDKLKELGYDTSNMNTGGGGGNTSLFGGFTEEQFTKMMSEAAMNGNKNDAMALVIASGYTDSALAIYDQYFGEKPKKTGSGGKINQKVMLN